MQSADTLYLEFEAQRETLEERWSLPWYSDRQKEPLWSGPAVKVASGLAGEVLDGLIERLLDHTSFALQGIALYLIAERERSGFRAQVCRSLDHPSLHVRALGAVAIGQLRDAEGMERLLDSKDSEHPEVKKAIVDTLRSSGDTRSIPLLARWVGRIGEDDELRRKACEALGGIGDAAAMPVLARVIEDDTASQEVRGGAACAVGQIGGPDAQRLLLRGLRSGSAKTVGIVTDALMARHDPRLPARLIAMIADKASGGRPAALSALVRTGDAQVLSSVTDGLTDEDPKLRAVACGLLVELEGRNAATRLVAHLADQDAEVRTAALAAYGRSTEQDFSATEGDLDAAVARATEHAAKRHESEASEGA